jgi:hypothetical protein
MVADRSLEIVFLEQAYVEATLEGRSRLDRSREEGFKQLMLIGRGWGAQLNTLRG